MFHVDERMLELVFDYCRKRLSLNPVPLDFGGSQESSLDAALEGIIGSSGHDPADVLSLFADKLATAVVSCDSPRFLSFIPAAPTKAALLFDMVVSCSSLQGTSWLEAAGAVAAENQALRVLADIAGLPPSAGGCFVSGGTTGNLSALVVARDTAASFGPSPGRRPRIAVGEEAHSSVSMALRVIAVDPLVVPCEDHRLTGASLRRALEAEADSASDVVAVVATAGTTNAGIVDDIDSIAQVARERSMWLHVDAAYGGAALFAPSARPLFAGIEHVDSLVVDPHKWLFAPFDCAALLYREPGRAKAVLAQDAAYLDVIHGESGFAGATEAEHWNPSDYALHLTRRARGLALWFSLAVNGTDAYEVAVEDVLRTARDAAALIERTPHVELVREPGLSVVLFRRPDWDRADYERWSTQLLADQIGFVTPTTWEGRPVARFAFLHPETTLEMVKEILATMR